MEARDVYMTPSEFVTRCLLGEVGTQQLTDQTDHLSSLLRRTLIDEGVLSPHRIQLVRPPINLRIEKVAANWTELIYLVERQVRAGVASEDILTYLIHHHFEPILLDLSRRSQATLALFDFIVEHVLRLSQAVQLEWDTGQCH